VHEQPADVRVDEAAQLAGQAAAVVDVRAVRVARAVREGVVLAMVGDPREMTGPSIAIEPRTASTPRTAGLALKLRCVKSRWKPTVTPKPVST
jgi:hypothetical protein